VIVEQSKPTVVAIDLSGVFDMEYTALKMLAAAELRMREYGITLWLVGLTPGVFEVVKRSPLGEALGKERMFYTLEEAVATFSAKAK
jgi:anti-anti-sigma regulatory factor